MLPPHFMMTMNTAYEAASNTNIKNTASIDIPDSSAKQVKGLSQLSLRKEESKFQCKIKPMDNLLPRSPDNKTCGDELSLASGVQFSNMNEVSPDCTVFKTKPQLKLKNILEKTQEYKPSSFVEIDEKQEIREEAAQLDNYTVELKDH